MTKKPSNQLELFANPRPERDYTISLECPEFTCLCPKTGQPDFATLHINYVPDQLCIELKSLKLYLWSYRDQGAFHEAVINQILDDLVAACKPRWMEIEGELSAGVLYASKVIFQNDLKVEAQVQTNSGSEITVDGLPDITIEYSNAVTKAIGDENEPGLIDDNHYIKVLGRQTAPGTMEAIHIIVKLDTNDIVKLQGILEEYTFPFITVLDQEIDLNTIPDDSFESPEGVSVTQAEFENRIASGHRERDHAQQP